MSICDRKTREVSDHWHFKQWRKAVKKEELK